LFLKARGENATLGISGWSRFQGSYRLEEKNTSEGVSKNSSSDQIILFRISGLHEFGKLRGFILHWTITILENFFWPKSAVVGWAAVGSFSASSEG
jgi:hypothetical protein